MKNVLLILIIIVVGVGMLAASQLQHSVYLPVVYHNPPASSPTPKLPTPAPTPTPTLIYTGGGYTWVFIGIAQLLNDGTVAVAGLKPGYCYDVVVHDIQDDKVAVLIAKEIQDGTWWCTAPPYNPDAPWPPPQFAPPTEIPPDIFYGEVFKLFIPRSVKTVCGYGGLTNCVEVIR